MKVGNRAAKVRFNDGERSGYWHDRERDRQDSTGRGDLIADYLVDQNAQVSSFVDLNGRGYSARVFAGNRDASNRPLLRWMKEPEFDAALRKARRLAYSQSIGRLQQASSVAATTLLKLMVDPDSPPSCRLHAGRKAIADAARRRWAAIKAGKAPSPFATAKRKK